MFLNVWYQQFRESCRLHDEDTSEWSGQMCSSFRVLLLQKNCDKCVMCFLNTALFLYASYPRKCCNALGRTVVNHLSAIPDYTTDTANICYVSYIFISVWIQLRVRIPLFQPRVPFLKHKCTHATKSNPRRAICVLTSQYYNPCSSPMKTSVLCGQFVN